MTSSSYVALVTGGNRGIGRGIVEGLAAEGATVALTARSAGAAEQAAREVGGRTLGFAGSRTRRERCSTFSSDAAASARRSCEAARDSSRSRSESCLRTVM